MSEAVVMFGLGANKAGSSWLYRYLSAHPDCHLPGLKELHYFDARAFGRQAAERKRIRELRRRLMATLRGARPERALRLAERIDELDDWLGVIEAEAGDLAAYRGFLRRRAGDARLVGDITPAYALLPEVELARMAGVAAKVRFVYFLRDPVDRLWSNIRMNAARLATGGADVAAAALELFDRWADGGEEPVWRRSDYAGTLGRMSAVLNPADVFCGFYETLFSPAAIERLCGFLGISPAPADFDVRVHAGVPVPLDDARQARARALLTPQYDHVRRVMGDLPARWTENMDRI